MPYLVSYYVVGVLFILASARPYKWPSAKGIGRALIILNFWPLTLFLTPEFLLPEAKTSEDSHPPLIDPVFKDLMRFGSTQNEALSEEERMRLRRVARSEGVGTAFFSDFANFNDVLTRFWEEGIPPEVYHALNRARRRLSPGAEEDDNILSMMCDPDWYIGLSAEFTKSIAKIDKNKRARVLEAVGKLAKAPTTPVGDTIKPLTGALAGLWRYRIGDDRLLYKPNAQSKKILLLSFGARGGSY